jgi:inhibitor of Bruton tyrosine kinase
VRQNQLAYLPFAKSGHAEAVLLELHADLAGALAQARERKIDSMRLRSRLHEDEERSASLNKFRIGSWGKSSSAPMDENVKSSKEGFSPGVSPALVAHDPGTELLFEMDDEKAHRRDSPQLHLDSTSPDLQVQDLYNVLEVETPNSDGSGWLDARGKPISGSVSTDASSLGTSFQRPQYSSSPAASRTPQSSTLTSGFASQNAPWNGIRSTSGKTGLKEIMAETSVSRESNLTLAMNAKSAEHTKGVQRMSQKERKKMQKQQALQNDEAGQSPATSASKPQALATSNPTSPWRPIRPSQKPDLTPPLSSEADHSTVPVKQTFRPPVRTTMTMRQTVAGTPPMDKSQSTSSKQSRSISTPIIGSVSKPAPPLIQSIRHTPATASTSLSHTAQSSMTDILLQQQTEKTAVKEAVAKRSLQEIQQQQEFEEWFDNESRRVHEEEAQATAAAAAASRDGRGKRGRGRGGHKRGSGRGGSKATEERLSISPTDGQKRQHTETYILPSEGRFFPER